MSENLGSGPPPSIGQPPISRGILFLLAATAGLSVSNIYYNQPLLGEFEHSFASEAHWVGAVPTATQLGYAAGMFFLAPLGDRFERRSLILCQLAGLCLMLAAAALAPNLVTLIGASLMIGILSTIAQQAVPFSAELARPEERGAAVGFVMSGLLLGILLARTVAGLVAQHFGWRTLFGLAVVAMIVLAIVVALRLPRRKPVSDLSYGRLLHSMWHLVRDEPVLREASITGGALFAAFSNFWSILALLLAGAPFHLGAQAAGLFGIVGAAGALAHRVVVCDLCVIGQQHGGAGDRCARDGRRRAGRDDFQSIAYFRHTASRPQPDQHGFHGVVLSLRRGGLGSRRPCVAPCRLDRRVRLGSAVHDSGLDQSPPYAP